MLYEWFQNLKNFNNIIFNNDCDVCERLWDVCEKLSDICERFWQISDICERLLQIFVIFNNHQRYELLKILSQAF